MDLTRYVEDLRQQLAVAADAGGDEARALAERLTVPLDAATRLVLLDALSAAADEITRELAPGSVEVRLRGRDPDFVVTPPPAADASFEDEARTADTSIRGALARGIEVSLGARPAAESEEADEGGGTSRI